MTTVLDGRDLGRLLEEATGALARLDAEKLMELERRARALQELIRRGAMVAPTSGLAGRHRVFADVVRATGESLAVLSHAESRGLYGTTRMRSPWGH